jgi:flagellar L-ring protein precursor FlgH
VNRAALKQSGLVVALALLAACGSRGGLKSDPFAATLPMDEPEGASGNGAIYRAGNDLPLFENAIAHRVGDTLTITLAESTAAEKSSSTTTAKKSTVDITAPTLGGKAPVKELGISAGSNNSFGGSGDSAQSNKLNGYLTVTVAKRLSNGNLVIRGQKWIGINQGREYVRIQGIVRPIDIQPDNTVPSYKVADATISYGAQGALADANQPGLLGRFFNSKWNPL